MALTAYFITGTDTGVGKTIVTAGLAAMAAAEGKRVCAYKPIQTGLDSDPGDNHHVALWTGNPEIAVQTTYTFAPPVAPWVADLDGTIEVERIIEDFQALQQDYDVVLVEGAGGVRVPIAPGVEMGDLMVRLAIPVLVVARPHLGTINHTLLTVEALQRRGLSVAGVIVSVSDLEVALGSGDPAVESLPQVFETFLPVPVLGWIPPLTLGPGCLAPGSSGFEAFRALLPIPLLSS